MYKILLPPFDGGENLSYFFDLIYFSYLHTLTLLHM